MSAWPERRRAAPVHALLDRVSSYVLRPPEAPYGDPPRLSLVEDGSPALVDLAPGGLDPLRPAVAVLGLAPRAGASTLARALAGRLAGLDPAAAAILVTADPPRGGIGGAAAARLARLLADAGSEAPRAAGRLAVVRADEPLAPLVAGRHAPVVVDVAHGDPPEAAVALADHVVLVCPPHVEPALAIAVEGSLRAGGRGVSLVRGPSGRGAAARARTRAGRRRVAPRRAAHARLPRAARCARSGGGRAGRAVPRGGDHVTAVPRLRAERGQATVLLLGVLGTLIAVALVLAAFGQAIGRQGPGAAGRRHRGRERRPRHARRLSAPVRAAGARPRRAQPAPPDPRRVPRARPRGGRPRGPPQRDRAGRRRRPLPRWVVVRAHAHRGHHHARHARARLAGGPAPAHPGARPGRGRAVAAGERRARRPWARRVHRPARAPPGQADAPRRGRSRSTAWSAPREPPATA